MASGRAGGWCANETERVRGYVLASFESAGLPPEGMPFVLEELEVGNNPYTIARAARALRGAPEVPADVPALLVRWPPWARCPLVQLRS